MPLLPIIAKVAAIAGPAALDHISARLKARAEQMQQEGGASGDDYQSDLGRRPTYSAARADDEDPEDPTEIVVYEDDEDSESPMRRIKARREGRSTPTPRSGRELERPHREPPSRREQERSYRPPRRLRRSRKWLAILLTLCLLGGGLFYVAPKMVPWWPGFLNPFGIEFPIKKQVQESTTVFKLKMENIVGTDIAKDNFKIDKHRVSFTGGSWWKLRAVLPGSVKEFHITGDMVVRYNINFGQATSEAIAKGKTAYITVVLPAPTIGNIDVGAFNVDEGGFNFLNIFGEDTPEFNQVKPELQQEARNGTNLNDDTTLKFIGEGALAKVKEIINLTLPGLGYTTYLNMSIKGTDGHIVPITTPVAPVSPAPSTSPGQPTPTQTPQPRPSPSFTFA